MDSLNENKPLPKEMILNSAENHFYRIGLSLASVGVKKRRFLYNPFLVFIVNILALIKSTFSVLLPEENGYLLLINGDFAHFLGLKNNFNTTPILLTLTSLSSQLIYFYNYKNDIKYSFLKLFEMMSGLVLSKSIGLTKIEEIYKLVKQLKMLFKWNKE
jgi:hypothetical protein